MTWIQRHTTALIATILLVSFTILLLTSSWNDSTIVDEISHVGAGYSYLTQQDMRLNPEHPPLVKDFAALPLLALDLTFPTNDQSWTTQVNGQWSVGEQFLYLGGNNAEHIIRLARLPIMLLSISLGIILFLWARKTYDDTTALLTLFFYVTSPTIIAHSRYVTTDIAATFGFVIGIISFLWWLKNPSWKRVVVFGATLGLVQLLKFSLILLVPIYLILTLLWCFAERASWKKIGTTYLQLLAAGVIASLVIWLVYLWHIWDYPTAKALTDTADQLNYYAVIGWHADLTSFLMHHSITRPWGYYFFGIVMVLERTGAGNTAYFLGEVGKSAWPSYFPVLYLLKETLAFHLLTVLTVATSVNRIKIKRNFSGSTIQQWIKNHFVVVACVCVIVLYWTVSIRSPLSIGVRHVLPTFPFIYLLVARGIRPWLNRGWKWCVFLLAAVWIILSLAFTFPYYLSYYNELAGGTWNGYHVAVDSNYDWGQDLKRLSQYMYAHPNETYYVDYFGNNTPYSGPQQYWLGEQFHEWHSDSGTPPSGSVLVVSIGFYIKSTATLVHDFDGEQNTNLYPWLKNATPFDRVGTSLLLFRIP